MFCRQCGNKISEGNTFCSNCGIKIIKNDCDSLPISSNIKEQVHSLPMNWYNFFTYGRLPLGIFFYCLIIFSSDFNVFQHDKISLGIFFIYIGLAIYSAITIYILQKKSSLTIKCVTILLIIESISRFIYCIGYNPYTESLPFILYVLVFIMIQSFFFIANYVYFNNRKHLFINE